MEQPGCRCNSNLSSETIRKAFPRWLLELLLSFRHSAESSIIREECLISDRALLAACDSSEIANAQQVRYLHHTGFFGVGAEGNPVWQDSPSRTKLWMLTGPLHRGLFPMRAIKCKWKESMRLILYPKFVLYYLGKRLTFIKPLREPHTYILYQVCDNHGVFVLDVRSLRGTGYLRWLIGPACQIWHCWDGLQPHCMW